MSLILASLVLCAMRPNPDAYRDEIVKWRQENEADLKKDDGWLAVAGLWWLPEGVTMFNQDDDGHVERSEGVIPPPGLAQFERTGRKVSIKVFLDTPVLVNGKKVETADLTGSDAVTWGSVTMFVIERGQRIGIRIYDTNNKPRKEFTGEKWFDIDPAYCIKAKYTAYDKPREMPITNVLGDTAPVSNPGFVEFTWKGKKCRLEAQDACPGLFFNFKDLTSGKSTYPAGRFLDAPKPVDGYVTVDFNRATNPPCAFTDFATCPLPPKANSLPVEIKAGEMTYHIHK